MTTVVAALNYFFGPLQGVDQDIQNSLLQAIKRAASPCKHRAKIQPHHMRTIINLGNADTDPKVIQAAALALIQFKALLRISEAQNLRLADIKHAGSGQWQVNIKKSKTDQGSKGALVAFRFSEAEAALWSKYIGSVSNATFLFQSGSTGLLAISTLQDRLKHLFNKANLQHFSLTSHSFRGGAATQALNMGVHQVDVMQAGRWSTLSGFRNYIAPKILPISTSPSSGI
ncbi:Site-specific recombinase phage integrase family [Trichostrongylus colubriformis]|uniref:Site-specific recombinase phage integrase family n=1 Tax=Trichostrongylus colubriformis TaxID=6319 RepID=A0AAN8F8J0_TRICO